MTSREGTLNPIRVIGYTCATNGIAAQEQKDAIVKYCEEGGHELVAIYNDESSSDRNQRDAALALILGCSGKVLVSTHFDVLALSIGDFQNIVNQLEAKGKAIALLEDGINEEKPTDAVSKIRLISKYAHLMDKIA